MTVVSVFATAALRKVDDEVTVEDLSLSTDRGTIYGFLGPNGAGKTMMWMLTTLTKPTSGRARVAVHPISDRDAVTAHICYSRKSHRIPTNRLAEAAGRDGQAAESR